MANTQKKVVVTGGSGFIGAYFCRELMNRGDEVVILDLIEPGDESPHHTYVFGDIRDKQLFAKRLSDVMKLFILQRRTTTLESTKRPSLM